MSYAYSSACYLPDGMVAKPPGAPCSGFNLLIPFILSSVLGVATHLLLGRKKVRDRLRFWNPFYLREDDADNRRWTPWSAIASTVLAIATAAVCGVLIRNGNNGVQQQQISIFWTTLLWLTRPRIAWVIIMLDVCLHRSLTETATDLLFQEALLGVLAIPAGVRMLQDRMGNRCGDGSGSYYYGGTPPIVSMYTGGVAGLISCGAVMLFMGVAMLWRLRFLKPVEAMLATLPTCGAFVCSWFLWFGFAYLGADGGFCHGNLAGVSVLQVALPVINSVTRSWVGYPGA